MLCASLTSVVYSQTPQFSAGTWNGVGAPPGSWPSTNHNPPIKSQNIYTPATFSGVKEGMITAVYLRNFKSSVNAKDTIWYKRFTMKLGYTNDSVFKYKSGIVTDTFRTGLSTIVDEPGKQFTGMKSNLWRKLPLNAGNFAYTKTKNLVMEIIYDSVNNSVWWAASHGSILTQTHRTISGRADIDSGTCGRLAVDFGFDLATTGIEAAGKVVSFGLFPNPSAGGQTNVSFSTRLPTKEVVVSVTSVTGQELIRRVWVNAGTEFFQEISLKDAPRGVYFVTTLIDGERITRRLLVN